MKEFTKDIYEEIVELNERTLKMDLPRQGEIEHPWDFFGVLETLKTYSFSEGIGEEFRRERFSVIKGSVYAGKNVLVGDFTKIVGPVILGDNVQICDYGYILGPAIIGSNTRIAAQVANSIILSGTKAVHRDIYIGDSIVGRNCNFGAGTITGNLRFDEQPPKVLNNGVKYEPGRKKLGSIIEHGVKFGINSSLKPGTYVSEGQRWIGNSVLETKK